MVPGTGHGLMRHPHAMSKITAIETALKAQKEIRQLDMEDAENKARADKKSDSDVTKAMTQAIDAHNRRVKSIENSLAELKLYQLIANGETNDALKQIKDVKDIPNERLAQLYLKLGDKDKAVDRAEVALMHRREHPDGLFAAHPFAIAHHLIGRWVHGGNETGA